MSKRKKERHKYLEENQRQHEEKHQKEEYKSQETYHGIVMWRRCLQRGTSHWGLSGATSEHHPKQQKPLHTRL